MKKKTGKGEYAILLRENDTHGDTLPSFSVMTLKLVERTPHVTTKFPSHTHTPTLHKRTPSSTYKSSTTSPFNYYIVTMPLKQAVVTYEAFREITNFIRDNGDDWGEFCHNTSHPSTMRKTVKTPPPSNQKVSHHKNAENKGTLAPEPLLQAMHPSARG